MKIDKGLNSTARIYAGLLNYNGTLKDASGNVTIKIYDKNGATPSLLTTATMTKLSTGLYYYAWNVTSVDEGNYEATVYADDSGNTGDSIPVEVVSETDCGDFNAQDSDTAILIASFADGWGVLKDAGTSATVTIYPANSSTPLVSAASATKISTGLYYYAWDISAVTPGNFTVVFDFTDSGNVYPCIYPVLVIDYVAEVTTGSRAHAYVWKLQETDTGLGIAGVRCYLKDSNGNKYSGDKVTSKGGYINWSICQAGTYSIYTDRNETTPIDTITITAAMLDPDNVSKGAGAGATSYVWRYTDSKGIPYQGKYCWLTGGTTPVDRVQTDCGGYILWKLDSGTYTVYAENSDTAIDTITIL